MGDGLVEHHDVVGDRVGAGIARTKQPRERITGAVGEAQQWMEPEPPLYLGPVSSLFSEWISMSDASMSR
jgi:hypothetical protein